MADNGTPKSTPKKATTAKVPKSTPKSAKRRAHSDSSTLDESPSKKNKVDTVNAHQEEDDKLNVKVKPEPETYHDDGYGGYSGYGYYAEFQGGM